jgi:hypothetical protein
MRAGGLLNTGIAVAPLALLAFLGIHGREARPAHVLVTPPAEGQRAITRFVEPVRAVAALGLAEGTRAAAPNPAAREVARQWVEGWRSGRLGPLPRASYDESVRDGYRSAIYARQRQLIEELARLASEAESSGDVRKAVEDNVLIVELAQVLRFEDLVGACSHSLSQKRALMEIERLAEVDPGQIARLREALNALDPLMELAQLLEREYRLFVIGMDVPRHMRTEQHFLVRDFAAAIRASYRVRLPAHLATSRRGGPNGSAIGLKLVARKTARYTNEAQRILERLAGRPIPIGEVPPQGGSTVAMRH